MSFFVLEIEFVCMAFSHKNHETLDNISSKFHVISLSKEWNFFHVVEQSYMRSMCYMTNYMCTDNLLPIRFTFFDETFRTFTIYSILVALQMRFPSSRCCPKCVLLHNLLQYIIVTTPHNITLTADLIIIKIKNDKNNKNFFAAIYVACDLKLKVPHFKYCEVLAYFHCIRTTFEDLITKDI